MNHFLLTALALSLSCPARADYIPQSFQSVALSADSEFLARVDADRWIKSEKRRLPDWVSIYRYDSEKREFVKVSEFPYGEQAGSGFLFISNGGQHVVGVNVGTWIGREKLGIRLYDQAGTLLKTWRIDEFLEAVEIGACRRTSATLQWFEHGSFSFDGKQFRFSGPGRERYRLIRPEDTSFHFVIDLKSLTLSRE